MIYIWKLNLVLLLSRFLVNLSITNIDKVVWMLFSQHRWTCVDSTFLFNLISTLKQHWVINIESTWLYQRCFVNVETTSINILPFSTKFQRWNNVGSSTLNRRNSINVVSTLFCQRWNNVDKCTSAQLSFSTKYQRWCVCWEVSSLCFQVPL